MAFPSIKLKGHRAGTQSTIKQHLQKEFLLYEWNEILPKPGGSIGSGSFGSVFVGKMAVRPPSHHDRSPPKPDTDFVVKKMVIDDDLQQRMFLKEARLLKSLDNRHVVKFFGISFAPCALILEYVYFDFGPFGADCKVSSLDQFLSYNNREEQIPEFPVHLKIALDTAKGLQYLHGRGIVHRDIKPANVLVSNQHYCDLVDEEAIRDAWESEPIVCKLADFGESRSLTLQTETLCKTATTSHVTRGTPVYRAPETFAKGQNSDDVSLSLAELKAIDVWALGMVFFILLNPDLKHPYQKELAAAKPKNVLGFLENIVTRGDGPVPSDKYCIMQATEWIPVGNAYKRCTTLDPRRRPTIDEVVRSLQKEEVVLCRNIPLSVSQNSALEGTGIQSEGDTCDIDNSLGSIVSNDGTNSCSFLSVNFAASLLQRPNNLSVDDNWLEIATLAEEIVRNTPSAINVYRNKEMHYDAMEAYQLLRSLEIIPDEYELTEEIIAGDGVFTHNGRNTLVNAVKKLSDEAKDNVAIYTCGGYIFTIGCRYGQYFVMDTHTINEDLSGNGNGLLKVFSRGHKHSHRWLTEWMWKRLAHSGIKQDALQSLTIMQPRFKRPVTRLPPMTGTSKSTWIPPGQRRTCHKSQWPAPIPTKKRKIEANSGLAKDGVSLVPEKIEKLFGKATELPISFCSPDKDGASTSNGVKDESCPFVNLSSSDEDDLERGHLNLPDRSSSVEKQDESCQFVNLSSSDEDDLERGQLDLSKRPPSIEKPEDQYWQGNANVPFLDRGLKSRYTPKEATRILLSRGVGEKSLCQTHPLRVRENASFCINIGSYDNWEDIKDDMNGAFTIVLRCCVWTVQAILEDGDYKFQIIAKKGQKLENCGQYHLCINSKGNKHCPKLVRSIFLLKNGQGNIVNNKVLLQYHIASKEDKVDFQVQCHGNRRNSINIPFFPSSKSLLNSLKEKVMKTPASHVYRAAMSEKGGSSKARTPGEIPRSHKQIYDLQYKVQSQSDPVEDLLIYARQKESKIVLRHEDMPTDLWILGTDVMCNDLVRCCTSDRHSHPIFIDPTFNMGQFEVTPIVYKNIFLTSKRTGTSPIFLGPTMIHHNKTVETYKVMASTCVVNCKGLRKCKGFVTDGEEALDKAWKTELRHAKHLRCIKHFEGNSKQKLYDIGIREKKNQNVFLQKVFGVRDKCKGLVDAEDTTTVQKEFRECKDFLDKQEVEMLQKKYSYKPQFSAYLSEKVDMIGKKMSLKSRRKAEMPVDSRGEPIRPYTNASESMNSVMAQTKMGYLVANKKGNNQNLSKLEFTNHVFEEIHRKEHEEVKLAICGLSQLYELAPFAAYLSVPVDRWFEWSDVERNAYVEKFMSLTVDDVLKKTEIQIPTGLEISNVEYKELSADVAVALKQKKMYKDEVSSLVVEGALTLLNLPSAIQKQPTLGSTDKKYEVASRQAKQGRFECVVSKNHVSCRCASFKFDKVCKHSIAVAEKVGILEQHMLFICKTSKATSRSALAEGNLNKRVAGKKGATNKGPYRPPRSQLNAPSGIPSGNNCQHQEPAASAHIYSEIYHNDNPFVLCILPPEAKTCKQCKKDFCHRFRVIPHDLVFQHRERYYFPLNGDWKNKQASNREATRYYHADMACIKARFPYFTNDYVVIPEDVKKTLRPSHIAHLASQFSLNV